MNSASRFVVLALTAWAMADGGAADQSLIGSLRPLDLHIAALQDEPKLASAAADAWRLDFNTWIWAPGFEGDVGVGNVVLDVSANFIDILEESDSIFAYSGRLEIGYGRWAAFIDGLYTELGVDERTGPLGLANIDVTFEQTIVDFGVMYRLGDWEPNGAAAKSDYNITLDLYAGARYAQLDLELAPAALPRQSDDADWIDPIVGAKIVLPFSEHWHLMAMGDVGGFGVDSDFTWSATAVMSYDFTLFEHPASVYFGYRAIGQDPDLDLLTWDVILHGPLLGFSLIF